MGRGWPGGQPWEGGGSLAWAGGGLPGCAKNTGCEDAGHWPEAPLTLPCCPVCRSHWLRPGARLPQALPGTLAPLSVLCPPAESRATLALPFGVPPPRDLLETVLRHTASGPPGPQTGRCGGRPGPRAHHPGCGHGTG